MRTRRGSEATHDIRGAVRLLGLLTLAILAVALLARGALGQEGETFDLTGTVVGEANRPLVGAFVSFAGSDWGSLTNEEGTFRIPDVMPGRIELEVEQLGYAPRTWRGDVGPSSDGLVIRLEPRAVMLEGLTVVTDRFRARRNAAPAAVRVMDRGELATSTYESAAQFIAARAGLSTTACRGLSHTDVCIWSRGRSVAPSIYVDEAPVFAGMEYLEMLEPHEVYLVEVYGQGRHIRVYTNHFMERAARTRLQPVAFLW